MNHLVFRIAGYVTVAGLSLTLFPVHFSSAAQTNSAIVPFQGCKSDGQVGLLDAPISATIQTSIESSIAGRLTLYQAKYGPAVLAPRGWFCMGSYGSAGATLYITPELISPSSSDTKWEGISGSGIQASVSNGDTSGRFAVATIVARVFPERKSFVERIIAEGLVPASDFPFGPFPADSLTYLPGGRAVEFQTPARSQGLGTFRGLLANGDPIRGVAILDGEIPDLALLAMRLPKSLNVLTSPIINQFETAH